MNENNIVQYCSKKKGATQEYPFGPEPLVMKVADKMFALFSDKGDYFEISLKCDPVIAENLREQHENVRPGYHMNKKHWNTVTIDGSMLESDIFDMIDHSYDLVFKKLPKSVREELSEMK
ncbi:MmcQ/YjbR family DNA-binding protein [Paenibacillus sp. GCM10012306]|uniref:MmcQ/YjbR family DNA-binding protein n=1 Tax=Paenibacillus sp. GCM10012306 TaxID=3317342 RepID=UPI003611BCDF